MSYKLILLRQKKNVDGRIHELFQWNILEIGDQLMGRKGVPELRRMSLLRLRLELAVAA